ncbi:MAG: aldo/keto reductase [Acidimicrobiales bacterium]
MSQPAASKTISSEAEKIVEYVQFGRTGLRVSKLCLGTMTFGVQCDEQQSFAILDKAFDAGITFIDTADVYPSGHDGDLGGLTEEIVGRRLKGKRDRVILASKFGVPMGPNPWNMGGSRKHILDSIDASLRRLNTDYLDLYQIHFFARHSPLDETLGALDDVVRSGKVRYIGCSNYAAWQLARAIGRSEALGIARYESVQPRYSMLFRNIERELLPLCEHDNVAVIPYNPLAGGFLSGKHAAAEPPTEGTRFTLGSAAAPYQERYWADDKFAVVDQIRPLAADAGMSMVQLALAWVIANPLVTAPIVGASNPEQLDDSLAALGTPLDADLKSQLDELTNHYRTVDVSR